MSQVNLHANQIVNNDNSHHNYQGIINPLDDKILCLFDTFLGFRYIAGNPNQYVVRTGLGIKDVNVKKAVMKKPYQTANIIDITPHNYTFDLHAMSNEKMEFILPGVFTIGPNVVPDDPAKTKSELKKYAIFLIGANKSIDGLIKGIIEGETRVLAAGMTIEDIFKNRAHFKEKIIENIHKELEQFGLTIFNANIKELQDAQGSEYFMYMRQKTREGAINQSKVDVAEARLKGTTGEKIREGQTRQQVADVEASTVVAENEKKAIILKSQAELKKAQAEYDKAVGFAELTKVKELEQREHMLSIEVEKINQMKNTEKLRAAQMSDANVKLETTKKLAEASAEQVKINAAAQAEKIKIDANALAEQIRISAAVQAEKVKIDATASAEQIRIATAARAEQIKIDAEAQKQAEIAKADAHLYTKQKEATGIQAVYEAEANGLEKLKATVGADNIVQYLMIERGIYQKLAEQNAKAIQGLNPKVTIWNTGPEASNGSVMTPIKEIMKALPPLMTTVQEQTGFKFPDFLGKPYSPDGQVAK
jgi:flotillin